ncbi:MAG: hypothetical protein WAW92_01450 [Minisyncoccia bacterium]
MQEINETPQHLPDNFFIKYTKEQVGEKLTDQELDELNSLVDQSPNFTGEDDLGYVRWHELDNKAK